MLHLTLKKGEYFMIGENIRIMYDRNDGKMVSAFGVDAPREIKITSGKVYENRVAKMAHDGDEESQQLLEQLQTENAERHKIFNARKAKRQQFHGRRVSASQA
ncbi:MAG: carbon storage regulator [Defluviitaleaceae bacterium]|nr:carbon storage regulator [Defluviitaleaceae bacterium]